MINSPTNASPIVLGFASAHGLQTNDQVYVTGCEGNTAANEIWTITKVDDTCSEIFLAPALASSLVAIPLPTGEWSITDGTAKVEAG